MTIRPPFKFLVLIYLLYSSNIKIILTSFFVLRGKLSFPSHIAYDQTYFKHGHALETNQMNDALQALCFFCVSAVSYEMAQNSFIEENNLLKV